MTITACGTTACSDFPVDAGGGGGAPGNAPSMFSAAPVAAPAPCITEPEDGTLFPNNWLRPRVKVSAPGATLLEIRFHAAMETNDLVVYTAGDNWAMDKSTWLNLAAHVVDQPITVTVRAQGSAGALGGRARRPSRSRRSAGRGTDGLLGAARVRRDGHEQHAALRFLRR